ncbi:unnamed protein product [Trichobilharzia szidati]|nr:unnamed protein product [Trichobilharzia szidati]
MQKLGKKIMNRLENPHEISQLMFEEEAFFIGSPLNTLNSNITTDCQHHSPHPSLGSFGSEEVRCSLDELDAVIATYDDDENNNHNNNSIVDVNNCRRQLFTSPLTVATNSTDYSTCSTFIPSSTSSNLFSSHQLSSTLQKNIELLSIINQSKNNSVITSKALPVSSLSSVAAAATTSVTTSMHFITSGTENTRQHHHHHHLNHHNNNSGFSNGNEIRTQCKDTVQLNSTVTGFNSSLQSFCTLTKHFEKTDSSPPLPPPPDSYASENFTLPPPPLSAVEVPALPYSSNTVIRQDTLKSLPSQFNSPSNGYLNRQISDPQHEVDTSVNSYCCTNNSRYTQSSNFSTNKSTTRPSIPQRAPSTRLTSVPNCSKQELDSPVIENTKLLNAFCESNGTDHLIKTTESCNANPVKTPSEISSKEENDSIERTTLPVQDIIRKFGSLLDSNAKIPNQCYTSSCSQNVIPSLLTTTTTTIRSNNSINDSLTTCQNHHLLQPDNSSMKTSVMRKYNQPTIDVNNSQNIPSMDNVNSSTKLGHFTNNGMATPTVLASQTSTTSQENHASLPSPSIMQVNQSINLSPEMNRFPQINNNNNNNNSNNPVKYNNLSPVFSTSFSPLLSSSSSAAPTSNVTDLHKTVESVYINRKTDSDRCDFNSTLTNFSSVSQTSMHHTNTSTFLSSGNMSGGGLCKAAHNNNNKTNNSNHSGNNGKDSALNHNPRVHHYQQQQHQQQLDSHVVHQLSGTLLQRRLSSDSTADSSSIVHVQSMNLDSNTLAILNQFNIVDATQIPGYHSIPPGLPDWKTHRLERKNREAASLYAEELKKWGLIPNWKRELIEKKQLNKMNNTSYSYEL